MSMFEGLKVDKKVELGVDAIVCEEALFTRTAMDGVLTQNVLKSLT